MRRLRSTPYSVYPPSNTPSPSAHSPTTAGDLHRHSSLLCHLRQCHTAGRHSFPTSNPIQYPFHHRQGTPPSTPPFRASCVGLFSTRWPSSVTRHAAPIGSPGSPSYLPGFVSLPATSFQIGTPRPPELQFQIGKRLGLHTHELAFIPPAKRQAFEAWAPASHHRPHRRPAVRHRFKVASPRMDSARFASSTACICAQRCSSISAPS